MNDSDFVIETGMMRKFSTPADNPGTPYAILREYHGPGGDVVIPEGVTEIHSRVFKENPTIRSVTLPRSLTDIGQEAFYGCTGLETVHFQEGLRVVENSAFYGCSALKEIKLPKTVRRIAALAFYQCSGAKTVELSEGLERLGVHPFEKLDGVEEFIIPCDPENADQIKFLASYVFDLDGLAEHYIRGHIRTCPALDKALFRRLNTKPNRKTFFTQYLKNQDADMTARFLSIIPKISPEELDEYILNAESCPEIRALFIDYKNKRYSAADLAQLETIQAEKDLGLRERTVADWKKIYKINTEGHITGYKDTAPVAEIPYKVRNTTFQVGANAFKHCDFLECVTIGEGVSLIDKSAFNGCVKLSQITIPSTLVKIGASAFKDCAALTDVSFPGGITNIGSRAFEGCTNLIIHAPAKSKIIKYAEKNGIPFVAE